MTSAVAILVAILGLALLMVVHEGGHHLVARAFKLRVLRFAPPPVQPPPLQPDVSRRGDPLGATAAPGGAWLGGAIRLARAGKTVAEQGNVITRAFSKFVAGLNSIGGVLIFAMIVMINLDVFSRFLFNHPIDGVTELVELSIVAIVFLQLSDAVRNGRLTRSEGLYSKICEKNPRLGHILGVFFDLAGAVFFVTVISGSIPRFIEAWERDYFAGNKGIFTVPIWPVRLVIVIGAITVVFVFLGLVMQHIKALKSDGGAQ